MRCSLAGAARPRTSLARTARPRASLRRRVPRPMGEPCTLRRVRPDPIRPGSLGQPERTTTRRTVGIPRSARSRAGTPLAGRRYLPAANDDPSPSPWSSFDERNHAAVDRLWLDERPGRRSSAGSIARAAVSRGASVLTNISRSKTVTVPYFGRYRSGGNSSRSYRVRSASSDQLVCWWSIRSPTRAQTNASPYPE